MIQQNHPLNTLTSMQTPASCAYFAPIETHSDLQHCMQHPAWHHPSRLILGGGTNLLLTHDVPGMVLQPNMKGMRILHRSQHHSLVSFKAAERWDDCVRFCLAHKLYGLENLSGIPGCIGAAAVQNIGAYGVELNSVFAYLDAFDLTTGYEKRFDLQACAFAYRDSFFKRTAPGRYLIHTVTLQCQHTPTTQIHYPALKTQLDASACIKPTPYDVRQAVLQCRASKLPDPVTTPNAGSFFKNPIITAVHFQTLKKVHPKLPHYPADHGCIKLPAAWLIEQCGFKDKEQEGIRVHPAQALVLTNTHKVAGTKVKAFAEGIMRTVEARFGIRLEPEVRII